MMSSDVPTATGNPTRHRPRYSLKALLLLMLVCGFSAGVWSVYVEPFRQQSLGIEAIRDVGGQFTPKLPQRNALQEWLVTKALGEEAYCHVVAVDLQSSRLNQGVEPEILSRIGGMRFVETLVLDHCKISDNDVIPLRGMPRLRELSLRYTSITDESMPTIATFPSLAQLRLTGTAVSDQGASKLSEASSLRELYARWTHISETAARDLRQVNPECKVYVHSLVP